MWERESVEYGSPARPGLAQQSPKRLEEPSDRPPPPRSARGTRRAQSNKSGSNAARASNASSTVVLPMPASPERNTSWRSPARALASRSSSCASTLSRPPARRADQPPPGPWPDGHGGDEPVAPRGTVSMKDGAAGSSQSARRISRMMTLRTPSLTWVFAHPARSSSSLETSCRGLRPAGAGPQMLSE